MTIRGETAAARRAAVDNSECEYCGALRRYPCTSEFTGRSTRPHAARIYAYLRILMRQFDRAEVRELAREKAEAKS
jgi:hypothetical protein